MAERSRRIIHLKVLQQRTPTTTYQGASYRPILTPRISGLGGFVDSSFLATSDLPSQAGHIRPTTPQISQLFLRHQGPSPEMHRSTAWPRPSCIRSQLRRRPPRTDPPTVSVIWQSPKPTTPFDSGRTGHPTYRGTPYSAPPARLLPHVRHVHAASLCRLSGPPADIDHVPRIGLPSHCHPLDCHGNSKCCSYSSLGAIDEAKYNQCIFPLRPLERCVNPHVSRCEPQGEV